MISTLYVDKIWGEKVFSISAFHIKFWGNKVCTIPNLKLPFLNLLLQKIDNLPEFQKFPLLRLVIFVKKKVKHAINKK